MVAATMASLVLRLMFGGEHLRASVTVHADGGSNIQSLVLEFFITFYLMFVIMGVATDDRAVTLITKPSSMPDRNTYTDRNKLMMMDASAVQEGQMAGLAVGGTIILNALFAGCVWRHCLLIYCSHQLTI